MKKGVIYRYDCCKFCFASITVLFLFLFMLAKIVVDNRSGSQGNLYVQFAKLSYIVLENVLIVCSC